MGVGAIASIFSGIISPVTGLLQTWQERKSAKVKSENAIREAETDARIKRLQSAQDGDLKWENLSIDKAGWKDDYWTILISVPAVMCFCGPAAAEWVRQGFAALNTCPQWYQWAFAIAFGSAFGVREFTKFMKVRKGD